MIGPFRARQRSEPDATSRLHSIAPSRIPTSLSQSTATAPPSDIFRKLYADRFVLYSDDVLDLHYIRNNLKWWPLLRNARFRSKAISKDNDLRPDYKVDGFEMLIDEQAH